MSRIMTRSHKMFDPLAPEIGLIDICDIAHALSMLCRANGHFKSFYSVCLHSINCAREAEARGYSQRVQLGCLLHDASEAYLSDVTRPVKQVMPMYLEIEEPLQKVIWDKWLQPSLTEEEIRQIFEMDDLLLLHEFMELMDTPLAPTIPPLMTPAQFSFTDFGATEREFLAIFRELTGEI